MSKATSETMVRHPVVSHEEWLAARTAFLEREKEFTRLRDALSRARRELPWERVEKEYVFETAEGPRTLAELFDGRSQLLVYHFMFGPDWEEGCPSCSFWADNFNPIVVHLNHRDVTMVAASHAPLAKLEAFRKRMGWSFRWVSSADSDFKYDYGASFRPEEVKGGGYYNYRMGPTGSTEREGASVFYKDPSGAVFHTYSAYARGIDLMNTAYNYLDIVPKGRDEEKEKWVQAWVRHHDRY